MLKPTSLIMGAGLGHDVACLTDGRFSGGYVLPLLLAPQRSSLTVMRSPIRHSLSAAALQIARLLHRARRP